MRKIVLIFGLALLMTACPMDRQYSIRLKNNSNLTIYACAAYILLDTLLPISKLQLVLIDLNKIGNIHGYQVNDDTFKRLEKGERLTLFVLSKDSVDVHSWEYLRENNIILKRYEFNMEELNNMGGSINYP